MCLWLDCFALLCPRYAQCEEVTRKLGVKLRLQGFFDTNLVSVIESLALGHEVEHGVEGVRVLVEIRLLTLFDFGLLRGRKHEGFYVGKTSSYCFF